MKFFKITESLRKYLVALCLSVTSFGSTAVFAQVLPTGMSGLGSTGASTGMAVGGSSAGFTFPAGSTGLSGVSSIRANEATEAAKLTSRAIALDPLKPNDFQQFILQTTGQRLPLFGYQFFENINASQAQAVGAMQSTNAFAPAEGTAVSPDYPLGVGDQLIIRAWGSIDVDVRATIDRNGQVIIPKVGAVSMAGVKVSQSEAVIKQALAKNYKGFEVNNRKSVV